MQEMRMKINWVEQKHKNKYCERRLKFKKHKTLCNTNMAGNDTKYGNQMTDKER